ncbi:MAG: carbohydrate ABC transporter permease [Haloarculaceae archaeon]
MSVRSRAVDLLTQEGEEELTNQRIVSLIALLVTSVLIVIPLYWMFATSIKTSNALGIFPPNLFPTEPTIQPYFQALEQGPWAQWFINTAFVSLGATLITLAITTPAAYALSRKEFPGAKPIYVMFVGVLMIPAQILLIPLFVLFSRLGLVNSRVGLMLAYSAIFLGFATFLLHSFFTNLPRNLEDAARIGGISEWKVFLRIILPLAKPGIATAAVFIFVFTWNEFLFALTFLQDRSLYTISIGLQQFQGLHGTVAFNQMFAMSTLATIPVVLLFAVFSEQFIQGMANMGSQ